MTNPSGFVHLESSDPEGTQSGVECPEKIPCNPEAGPNHQPSTIAANAAKPFAVLTLHRPSNVDDPDILARLVNFFCDEVAPEMPLLWPIHPRTRSNLEKTPLWEKILKTNGIHLLHPLGYHALLKLNSQAAVVFTDSGGLQEECCVLGTPCITLRWNTERPVTLKEYGGVSILVGNDIDKIRAAFATAKTVGHKPHRPPLWDGDTAQRIINAILNFRYLGKCTD